MYNRDYEEYMKSVLGYKPANEIYNNTYNVGYNRFPSEYTHLYPEIYNKLNPIISRMCEMNSKPINETTLNEMIDAIIANVNLSEYTEEPKLKNGDVRNPNAKENRKPNKLLHDILKIMILNKLTDISKIGHNLENMGGMYPNF